MLNPLNVFYKISNSCNLDENTLLFFLIFLHEQQPSTIIPMLSLFHEIRDNLFLKILSKNSIYQNPYSVILLFAQFFIKIPRSRVNDLLYVGDSLNAITVFQSKKAFVAFAGTVARMLCEREKV